MNTLLKLFLTLAMLAGLAATRAEAHPDSVLDTMKGPHGGQLRMAGAYHLELVAGKNLLTIYVMDHANKAQPIDKLKLRATVINGKQVSRVEFAAKEANQLQAAATFTAAPELQVIVTLEQAGQAPLQAKFQPLKPAPKAEADHDHSHEKGADHHHGDAAAPAAAHQH